MSLARRITNLIEPMCITIALSIAAVALQFWIDAPHWLGYQWQEFTWTQSYRIMACNWLHFSWNHLAWDLVVFVVLAAMCEMRDRSRFMWMLVVASISIPLVVRFTHYGLGTYRGLSGIDSGLFALLALSLVFEHTAKRDWRMVVLFVVSLVALIAKIGWEIHKGGNIFVSDQAFVPVPLAHVTGVLIGLSIAVAAAIKQLDRRFNSDAVKE